MALMLFLLVPTKARSEVILQFFETPWAELEARMPEIAAAGYGAIWLPPPTKGSEGTRDVGFAVYDRFDLGDRFSRGTVATRYGTREDLVRMTAAARRFGVRVYFDVVMNHNGNPNMTENTGVDLPLVDLDEWPGMTPFDFHLLPAFAGDGSCGSGCEYCAWQANAEGGPDWRVVNESDGGIVTNDTGALLCLPDPLDVDAGEDRIAAVTLDEARAAPGGDDPDVEAALEALEVQGYTHLVRGPRMDDFTDFGFEILSSSLLGLIDIATEQHADESGPLPWDGYNAVNGIQLPRYVRHPGETHLYPDGAPAAEDVREMLLRWIRWLMIETGASGFRLDAIKHTPTSFFDSDYEGDPIAFNRVIQDTYDEVHGFTDANDNDLVDDAAIFGESFNGNCDALRPYIDTGMRALDFPLFFNLFALKDGNDSDLSQFSLPKATEGCSDVTLGALNGLNRRAGVAFAHSHDECQVHEHADREWTSPTFSLCTPTVGNADLVYAFVLTRDSDSTVFFDGNNWTSASFVRAGRPDALGDVFYGAEQPVIVRLVDAHRRIVRGTDVHQLHQRNLWVSPDAYAYESFLPASGATGVVVLNDRTDAEQTFGEGSSNASFIFTSFPPGTELVELTGNAAYPWAERVTVLDQNAAEQPEVTAARANYNAANGVDPPAEYGVLYTAVRAGPTRNYVVYAPAAMAPPSSGDVVDIEVGGTRAVREVILTATDKALPDGSPVANATVSLPHVPAGSAFDVVVRVGASPTPTFVAARLDDDDTLLGGTPLTGTSEGWLDGFRELAAPTVSGDDRRYALASVSTAGLDDGVHALRVRVTRAVTGAADAHEEHVIALCLGDVAACQPRAPSYPTPPDDGGVDGGGLEDGGVDDAGPEPPADGGSEHHDGGSDDGGAVLDGGQADAGDGGPSPEEALIAALAKAIATRASGPAELDLNEDGRLDVSDLDVAIGRALAAN